MTKPSPADYSQICPCMEKCPLSNVLENIGGKWKVAIICALSLHEQIRYNELKRMVKGITNTMLASSLKDLENIGMVIRKQYPEMPVRVEYSLTEKGKSILPILEELRAWSMENLKV